MRSISALLGACALLSLVGNAPPPQGVASEQTASHNSSVAQRLPLTSDEDFKNARRGLLAQLEGDILNDDGTTAWAIPDFDFLNSESPSTVNPSLWRQSQLTAIHGLFEVVPGIYQIRGYDLSVMTLIAGESGWIVIDPLLTPAPAKAGLALANATLGERPVVAVLYTHSHADHFGGVLGVTSLEALAAGEVEIIAPAGFTAETVGESVLAGAAMGRRAQYQFGANIPVGAQGVVGVGLGPKLSTGPIGLLPPTRELGTQNERLELDGVVFEFLDAGGTEAPSEFVFYLPQYGALHVAEVATRNFHNILTPRGALVRDSLKWSRTLDDILMQFGTGSKVMLASHHWPIWGSEKVREALRNQRDMYRFTHDQTLRLANQGATMDEIADAIGEPDFARNDFGTRGYYGTYEHNSRAVYQRYFGWWNAVPADYNPLPKAEEASKWVEAIGGSDAALAKGQEAFEAGDYRWGARLLQNLVFADPENEAARLWLAATYEQLGFQSEGGTWRNIYLSAADELRKPRANADITTAGVGVLASVPTIDLFDALATRFNPAKMRGEPALLQFSFSDTRETITVDMRRSVMYPRKGEALDEGQGQGAAAVLTIARSDFNRLLAQEVDVQSLLASGAATIEGNPMALLTLFQAFDRPDPQFDIVIP